VEAERNEATRAAEVAKDERNAALGEVRQQKLEMGEITRRHALELERYAETAAATVSRFNQEVTRLKEIHLKEIESLRARSAELVKMGEVYEMIQATAGTLKLLEAQGSQQRVDYDVTREAQLEARERLLGDLTASSHATHDSSEREVAKLQGVLSSMGEVSRNMRSSQLMEAERLRGFQERVREQSEAESLLASEERRVLREERAALNERTRNFETDKRELEKRLADQQEMLEANWRRLETERDQFLNSQASAVNDLESRTRELDEREAALRSLQGALEEDAGVLSVQTAEAKERMAALQVKAKELDLESRSLQAERQRVAELAAQVEAASEVLQYQHKDARDSLARAEAAKKEAAAMRREAAAYKDAMDTSVLDLERQRLDMAKMTQELQHRKAAVLDGERQLMHTRRHVEMGIQGTTNHSTRIGSGKAAASSSEEDSLVVWPPPPPGSGTRHRPSPTTTETSPPPAPPRDHDGDENYHHHHHPSLGLPAAVAAIVQNPYAYHPPIRDEHLHHPSNHQTRMASTAPAQHHPSRSQQQPLESRGGGGGW